MTTITIALPDDRLQKLKETAAQLNVSPEELVQISIEELITRPEDAFHRTADYVLKKNDFGKGVRGKYAKRCAEGTNIIVLSPDVAQVFHDSDSVNDALRVLVKIARQNAKKASP